MTLIRIWTSSGPIAMSLSIAAGVCGCESSYQFASATDRSFAAPPDMPLISGDWTDARLLPMFAAREDGARVDWASLLAAVRWADVIFIGEEHDDALGHRVQLAVVEDVLAAADSPRSIALSMEMFERNDQSIVDDYLADLIDVDEFVEQSNSAGWPDWTGNYQPIIDAAKSAGAPVIAANAPRRYVRLARTHGYEFLRSLSPAQRALFELPTRSPSPEYVERFREVMSEPMEATEDSPPESGGHQLSPDEINNAIRSQLVWDATMGTSIARALRRRDVDKVIHLAGSFHSDFNGGTVQMLRASTKRVFPFQQCRILTISLVRSDSTAMRDEDRNRADIVIYTGELAPSDIDAANAQ